MKRILFVDDEVKVLDGIRRLLYSDRNRWDMQFALGGEDALLACEKGSFDVVISDMRMPGMDGATLLRHIRERYPDTARIIMSGYSEASLVTRSIPVAHRFLVKPCDSNVLRDTIERVCVLQDLLGAPNIRRIVGSIGELPSLSETYTALTNAVNDPDSSIGRVAEIIGRDMAMSAKVLQLVNSAFFGLAHNITNLSSAVAFLGMETTKNLVLASETFRAFTPDARIPKHVCESLNRHSLRSAWIAGALPVEAKARDSAIVASLLHDIGRLFLASTMPAEFCDILSLAESRKCTLLEAEVSLLETSHAEIGAYLLGLWGLPSSIVEAVAHHQCPTRIPHIEFDAMVAVYVADILAKESEPHLPGGIVFDLESSERGSLETLGIWSRLEEFRKIAREYPDRT